MESWFRLNRILLQKLVDTHFSVSEEEFLQSEDLAVFNSLYKRPEDMERAFPPLDNTIAKLRNPNGVFIGIASLQPEKKQVSTDELARVVKKFYSSHASTLYLILEAPLSAVALLRLNEISSLNRVVRIPKEMLMFNITKHVRVPKHELLSPNTAKAWLVETGIKPSQMPRIFSDDPQVIYLDGLVGDIIKVIRPSPTVGLFIHHLYVARRLNR